MAKKRWRDLSARQQLARAPLDLPFLMLVVLLTVIGVLTVFSASYASAYYEQGKPFAYFIMQGGFAVVGLGLMFLVSRLDYQVYRKVAFTVLIGAYFLLVLVFVPGIGRTSNGATRWIKLGPLPSFQPSELAKIAIIMWFAARLSIRDKRKKRKWKDNFWGRLWSKMDKIGLAELVPYVAALALMALLLLAEPHMSATILILASAAAVLWAAGIHLGWFAFGGGVVIGGLALIMTHTDYMLRRLTIHDNPWSDPQGGGFQIIQSLYAIGSGGLLGKGFGQSMQKYLYLPEEHNDFVFAVWCEEMGLIGAVLVLVLFALLVLRGYWIALHARDKFGALLVVGITTQMAVQVFLNIAVVTNLIPVTGISLPFFSYGGTALIVQLVEMGIVLAVSRQCQAIHAG